MSVISNHDDVAPNVIVHIIINDDGAREISLRSVLCFKNNINRPMYLMIRYLNDAIEYYLQSDAEWSIPIKFTHPKAKVFCKLSKDDNWMIALSSLSACVQQVYIHITNNNFFFLLLLLYIRVHLEQN